MAKITWTFENTSGTITHTWTLSDARMARVTGLLRSVRPRLSAADAVEKWMIGEEQRIKDWVLNSEAEAAGNAARDGVGGMG